MRANKHRFGSRLIAPSLVLAILSFSAAQAAEGVRWIDLPKKIGRGKVRSDDREDRQYRVVTKDGRTHVGYKLAFSTTHVRLSESGPSIPSEQVVEIRIHRDALLSDALLAPARALFSGVLGSDEYWFISWKALLMPVLVPVALGVVAATAPVVLPVEAVKRRLPDKVIRVAP